ncbi:hypothetical protein Mycch_5010 [Mycolicibacterium chubuense NBB4]|uniref:Uncharacterized protein n=2 Tax=Mycolicibacterium chubuense TaxID=1800 RepID=I4BQZ0_MYCCN|nr:hypothetical protein Mycch_5010 [Mycolicibacterium chubuense NBB4]
MGLNGTARQPDAVAGECYEQLMTNQCRACRAGLEHCHGALIHHPYRRDECTEDECVTPDSVHDLHLDCSAVGCACDEVMLGASSAHRVG